VLDLDGRAPKALHRGADDDVVRVPFRRCPLPSFGP
jgi:hypothetical protein